MDKEKLITIALGLFVGVALAGAYFAAARFLPQLQTPAPKVVFNPPKSNPSPRATTLTVTQPTDEATTKESPLAVSGQAAPAAQVVIFAPADEKIASADAAGKFATTIKLEEGTNPIGFSVISAAGQLETITRNVILEIGL